MEKRRKRQPKGDANFLPGHIGEAFQQELTTLVEGLSLPESDGTSPALERAQWKISYLQSEFLSKYCDANTTPASDRAAAAIKKWQASEDTNRQTNIRLYYDDVDFGYTTSEALIQRTAGIIKQVLGGIPADLFDRGSHTNGASTRVGRSSKAALQKHLGEAHVSHLALPHWCRATQGSLLRHQMVRLRGSSELFTVPKSSDIDRAACKEPEVNLYLQRCVGGHIRKRLRKFGINLNDQTVNQRLARDALEMGLATIDLSAASDSITKQLVFKLLPFEWWSLLDDLRVHYVQIDDTIVETEMFSSMGNGFTFELESLIFWALTRAIAWASNVKGTISVFGDDIIAPAKLGPRIKRTFAYFGFKVNAKKSHWSGYFRESCGKHYFRGLDVTPFYIREPVRTKTDVIRLLNRLLDWDGRGWGFFLTEEIALFHKKWSKVIPQNLYGGSCTEDISSLVTGDMPRRRLIPKNRDLKLSDHEEIGRYLLWHTVRNAVGQPICVEPAEEIGYKLADSPPWAVKAPWTPYIIYGD